MLVDLESILGRNRSTWSEHLRTPRTSLHPLGALDDVTSPDGRPRAPWLGWLAWLRARLTGLGGPAGEAGSATPVRDRLPAWLRAQPAWLARLRDRLPASVRDSSGALVRRHPPPDGARRLGHHPGRGPAADQPGRDDRSPGSQPDRRGRAVDPRDGGPRRHRTAGPGAPGGPGGAAPGRETACPGAAGPPRETPDSAYSVLVTSAPPGAQAWVSGERVARGRTPIDIQLTSPRPRRVQLAAPGFRTTTVIVSSALPGGHVHARLLPAVGPARPAAGRRQLRPTQDPLRTYRPMGD